MVAASQDDGAKVTPRLRLFGRGYNEFRCQLQEEEEPKSKAQ